MAHSQPTTTLLRRIVTEKTSRCEGDLTYVFKVLQSATKKDVFEAVKFMYGVKPTRVNMLRVKGKVKSARGKSTAGGATCAAKAGGRDPGCTRRGPAEGCCSDGGRAQSRSAAGRGV